MRYVCVLPSTALDAALIGMPAALIGVLIGGIVDSPIIGACCAVLACFSSIVINMILYHHHR
jgi:uncharacterized membrane protein